MILSNTRYTLPDRIEDEAQLEEVMSRPGPALIEMMRRLNGRLLVLGAGGKMGPTLSLLARRAADAAGRPDLDVIAVSRFGAGGARAKLEAQGVRTISADLMDEDAVAQLPDASNIIYLVGLKFGTGDNPALTWAMNVLVPANVARRYPAARIAALSSGNVYPLVPVATGGAREDTPLTPIGDYPNSVVARERIFEYFSRLNHTPMTMVRLSYALDLRYGVLVDIATKVWRGEPLDLTNGYFNAIWQGDANDFVIRSLDLAASPPQPLNLTRRELFSVRAIATEFGRLMGREVMFAGQEAADATLINTELMHERLGEPAMPMDVLMGWVADWIARGGPLLNKPTHFEVRDGRY